MHELKELVEQLEKLTDENNKNGIVKTLQAINTKLLTEYEIKISDTVTVTPLLVEAYYYSDNFKDENTYQNDKQRGSDRFGKLFFHDPSKPEGVDICLPNGDYYLSFLIKNSLVRDADNPNVKFMKQVDLHKHIAKSFDISKLEKKGNVLDKSHREHEIVHTVRKGMTKESFRDEPLASLPVDMIRDYPFENKERVVKKYIDDTTEPKYKEKTVEITVREYTDESVKKTREDKCIKYLGYRSKYVVEE